MTSFVEPIFLVAMLLSVSTLVDTSWVRQLIRGNPARRRNESRRMALAAADTSRGLAAKVVALSNPYALPHGNVRIKTDRIATRAMVAAPERARVIKPVSGPQGIPRFAGKLEDIVGLYLSPPEHALIWCCDDRPRLQVVNSTRPGFADGEAIVPGTVRHHGLAGPRPLADALGDLYGSVIGGCKPRERHTEWLKFLRQLNRQTPRNKQLHMICDNQVTHDHPAVRKWLAAHPRLHVHFAPRSASGLKMIRRFFNDVIAEQPGRGVSELTAAISRHVKVHVPDATPFVWVRKQQRSLSDGLSIQQATVPASRRDNPERYLPAHLPLVSRLQSLPST